MEEQQDGKKILSKENSYESKCKRCGECCKVVIVKEGVNIPLKCEFQKEDNTCSCYSTRPDWCQTPENMKRDGTMPDNCGYKEVV